MRSSQRHAEKRPGHIRRGHPSSIRRDIQIAHGSSLAQFIRFRHVRKIVVLRKWISCFHGRYLCSVSEIAKLPASGQDPHGGAIFAAIDSATAPRQNVFTASLDLVVKEASHCDAGVERYLSCSTSLWTAGVRFSTVQLLLGQRRWFPRVKAQIRRVFFADAELSLDIGV